MLWETTAVGASGAAMATTVAIAGAPATAVAKTVVGGAALASTVVGGSDGAVANVGCRSAAPPSSGPMLLRRGLRGCGCGAPR